MPVEISPAERSSLRMRAVLVRLLPAVCALLLCLPSGALAQTRPLSGIVRDAQTGEALPSATIRLAGSSRGTLTNARGEFQLPVPASGTVIASYVGYRTDSLDIAALAPAGTAVIRLQPVSIQLPGLTITDEDPAYEIIRRAIEEKKKWMARLERFEGRAFTRMALRSDTSIASITESYSTLYWSQHDTLREVITQTRKTGNLPSGFRPSTVGSVMNFNDNEIAQLGFRFIGPTSPDAFRYYDYKLVKTRMQDDFEVYDIDLLPRTRSTPLFYGRISIAERSYAVIEVDVRPNEAFVIPFVRLNGVRYRQHFGLYEERFWLPADYRTEGSITVALAGIRLPAIGMEKDVVIYDYLINPVFADSIRRMNPVTFDSTSNRFDSSFWAATNVLPLTAEQERAYETLDSTQTLAEKFKPTGAAASLADAASAPASILNVAEVYFNRVEGLHLGAHKEFSRLVGPVDVRVQAGYGFSDRAWKYSAGLTIPFGWEERAHRSSGLSNFSFLVKEFAVSADVYRMLAHQPEEKPYSFLSNSVAALVSKLDYYDYYKAEGWKTAFSWQPSALVGTSIEYRSEENRSARQSTDYSFFNRSRHYREQPVIDEGQMRALTFSLVYGHQLLMNFMPQALKADFSIEYSDRDVLASSFSYSRWKISLQSKLATGGRELLFPQSLFVKFSTGFSTGTLPIQRSFDLLSGLGGYGQVGTFRALHAHEFYGDWFASLNLEQNFRRAPLLWLGLSPLYRTNWEFLVTASVARTPNSRGLYYEAGFGINNIFDLLRIDLTYRFVEPRGVSFSLSFADFFSGLL